MALLNDLAAEFATRLASAARQDGFRSRAELTREKAARSRVAAELRHLDYELRTRVHLQLGRTLTEDERRRAIEALAILLKLRFPARVPLLTRAASNESFGDVLDELWSLLEDLK